LAPTDPATVIVSSEDEVAGLVENTPVIPAGQLMALSVTAEAKPLLGVTVTVEVPLNPAEIVAAGAASAKLGAALAVKVMVVAEEMFPYVPVKVSG
jgi:hypothetical protein